MAEVFGTKVFLVDAKSSSTSVSPALEASDVFGGFGRRLCLCEAELVPACCASKRSNGSSIVQLDGADVADTHGQGGLQSMDAVRHPYIARPIPDIQGST